MTSKEELRFLNKKGT